MPPRKAEAPLINNMPRVGAADPFANLFGAMGGLPAPAAGGAGGALAGPGDPLASLFGGGASTGGAGFPGLGGGPGPSSPFGAGANPFWGAGGLPGLGVGGAGGAGSNPLASLFGPGGGGMFGGDGGEGKDPLSSLLGGGSASPLGAAEGGIGGVVETVKQVAA